VLWGIITLLVAFFLAPFARKTLPRLFLAGLYVVAAMFFLNELFEIESPLYYHFIPQTFALFDFSFVSDLLSMMFACLITGTGAFVMAYSAFYIDADEGPRFSTLISFFTLSMLGLVLSNNLLGFFIFWEFTTICSYFLICFDTTDDDARKSAWQALLITAFGGLCLLCGILILGGIGESYDLLQFRLPQDHPWMGPAMILIFLGVFTKSAQFPFHFWLPNASPAPAPATAFLHSATMVQAGVFLLFRLSPFLSSHPYWSAILVPVGLTTSLLAAFLVILEKDLKKILAYTTISALGLIVYMIGKNTPESYYVAFLWLIAHAFYKAPLFLLAGNIERYSGSRDVTTLAQLYPRMKGSLLVAFLGLFSLLGLPPTLSGAVKNVFFNFFGSTPTEFFSLIFIFSAAGSVGFTLLFIFLKNNDEPKIEGRFFDDEDDPALLWLPPLAALIIPFMIGIRFGAFSEFIRSNLGPSLGLDLSGVNTHADNHRLEIFSVLTIFFVSIFIASFGQQLRSIKLRMLTWNRAWDFCFDFFLRSAKFIFAKIQNQRIELYVLASFAFLIFLLALIPGVEFAIPLLSLNLPLVTPFEIALMVSVIFAALMALRAETNLSALIVLGVVGFGIAYFYLINAAPDLALAQFLVETLILLLVVLTFKDLPKAKYVHSRNEQRGLFLVISMIVGLFAGTLTFLASSGLRPKTLTRYFGEKSVGLAHGRNVVDVIVTDFRGFDTLGEIVILAAAAVGVASLLKKRKAKKEILS